MRTRTTLILLAIVLAFAAYIRFYERHQPNTEEATRQSQNVINFDPEKVEGLTIQNGDDKIDLRKEKTKWRIEAPVKDQADSTVVNRIVGDLENWPKLETISGKELANDKKKLEEFGLLRPKLKITLLGKDLPPTIAIGNDAAIEGKMYVQVGNSRDVLVASKTVREDSAKKPEEFRDKKLTDLATAQVNRVVLKSGAGEIELQKSGEHGEITRPLRARADDQRVADLIAQITTAQVQQFVGEDRGDLQRFGLAEPRGSVTLFAPEAKEGQTLSIGAPHEKEKEQVYARFSARASIYSLPKKIEDILNTKPVDLRDRHLVRFDANVLDRITIEAAGHNKAVLARNGESWTIVNRNNQPANNGEVTRLIDGLKNEQVARFVEDVASNLPKYGLDKPQLQVTLSSFASENTAETKAGEHPFATIAFGAVEGDQAYARLVQEPFVVAVSRQFLDSIPRDALQLQELSIFKFQPEQVHRFSVVTDRELSLTRGPNGEWKWLAGSGEINQVNVQSLLNTLSKLRAVRWVGDSTPAQGLEKPQLVLTFTTSPDDKQLHKLVIGGPTGDGMWSARTDEREGTFVINNPDLSAL